MSFKSIVSMLIFCLDDLSIVVSGVLKSSTTIVLLSMSSFMFVVMFVVVVLYILVLAFWVHKYVQLIDLPVGQPHCYDIEVFFISFYNL